MWWCARSAAILVRLLLVHHEVLAASVDANLAHTGFDLPLLNVSVAYSRPNETSDPGFGDIRTVVDVTSGNGLPASATLDVTRRVELATYAGAPLALNGSIDCRRLQEALVANGANSYNFLLEDADGRSYLSTVVCLEALRGFSVSGVPFSAWLTLIPPTEATGSCSVPADSPLTPFNETALFNQSKGLHGCQDYEAWAEVTGKLAIQFSSLRYLNVDDLTHNPEVFTDSVVRRMGALLRPNARLIPVVYYGAHKAAAQLPIDGMLFYFRNEKEGGCPAVCGVKCSVEWPHNACLAGTCAEKTVSNLAGEVSDVRAALPSHLPLHVGVYVTGRPASGKYNCSTPSPLYGRLALEAALRLPDVSGVTAYRMQVDATPQRASVAAGYTAFNGSCPTRTPFVYHASNGGGALCCGTTSGFPDRCDLGPSCCLSTGQGCQGQTPCQTCPTAKPHIYGSPSAGWFCCPNAANSSCPGGGECCAAPGLDEGCQGRPAC
jgi:hypothetical protein